MNKNLTPHITEKSYRGISEDKKSSSSYTFNVPTSLTKETIKRTVEKEYKVSVEDVRIINIPGKRRRFKGIRGVTQATKKAIVRVKAGDRIAAFDIEEKQPADKQ